MGRETWPKGSHWMFYGTNVQSVSEKQSVPTAPQTCASGLMEKKTEKCPRNGVLWRRVKTTWEWVMARSPARRCCWHGVRALEMAQGQQTARDGASDTNGSPEAAAASSRAEPGSPKQKTWSIHTPSKRSSTETSSQMIGCRGETGVLYDSRTRRVRHWASRWRC